MVNQSKLKSKRNTKRYKFGFEVPRNLADAIRLDKENKNTRWKDAMALELSQIMEYKTFLDRGYMGTSVLLATSAFERIGCLTSSTMEDTRQDLWQVDTSRTLQ